MYNLYGWYQVRSQTNENKDTLISLIQQNSESQSELGYYSSEIYKEKYAKSNGFKNEGEDVIDTSLTETNDTNVTNYIPNIEKRVLSNPEKWFTCFFGAIDPNTKDNYANFDSSTIVASCR
ncbi:MAG: hypothetical protein AAGF07_00880 [Patescibacteria group bacterium]